MTLYLEPIETCSFWECNFTKGQKYRCTLSEMWKNEDDSDKDIMLFKVGLNKVFGCTKKELFSSFIVYKEKEQ